METHLSRSPDETKELAAKLAARERHGGFICLYGDLGSGKTVFAKGFAQGVGVTENEIKSPTYTLVRQYPVGKKTLYHFDFYRVEEADDLMSHDLEEIFSQKDAWIIIEWPERIQPLLPPGRTNVHLEYKNETERIITIEKDDESGD